MGRHNHYHVYVVELSNDVLYDDMEVELAIDLRESGYGVWQA